jgi:glycogen debranching enzyme
VQGLSFTEWNAGPNLDHAMRSEGFQVKIGVDANGFVYGGNRWNCGTWMDKMGDSAEAGNRGIPATPRDGSAVELVGLVKRALRCVKQLLKQKDARWHWEVVSVTKEGKDSHISYEEWEEWIQESFELNFYIPKGIL